MVDLATGASGVLAALQQARRSTDALFALLRPEFLYERPLRERHRIIFYVGHLEAFDWNLLRLNLPGLQSFAPQLDRLFAFGIDPIDGQLPNDQPSEWPSASEMTAYCAEIRQRADVALQRNEIPAHLLDMAVEHRWMHAETLSYMLHQLPFHYKFLFSQPHPPQSQDPTHALLPVPSGPARLGAEAGSSYGWDNEFDAHTVQVPSFSIARYKVTNAQYLAFVEAGGYQDSKYWRPADWAWVTQARVAHPAFWIPTDSGWHWRGISESLPLPMHWPVFVSQAEASAYALWAGMRLPTEAEFHRAAYAEGQPFPWGQAAPNSEYGYFDTQRWDPSPVNAFPAAGSSFGVEGLLANGWEWTSTVFAPFNGFAASPNYPGYSANFFDGLHYVLKGGSPRTEKCMLRSSFRNWFQPHYPYVYAGFRCVEADSPKAACE